VDRHQIEAHIVFPDPHAAETERLFVLHDVASVKHITLVSILRDIHLLRVRFEDRFQLFEDFGEISFAGHCTYSSVRRCEMISETSARQTIKSDHSNPAQPTSCGRRAKE